MNLRRYFWVLALLLVAATVIHSMWATSLDSYTIDEPYHIAAGATYLRWHDFRVNPEHPPLVKIVAALAEPEGVLHLGPLEISHDKSMERVYTQTAVFYKSDSEQVRHRARGALYVFHAALLLVLAWLLMRVFSPAMSLIAMLLLALDPTVSAHMPVAMTDLPMALLGAICFCLAVLCVREMRWPDWLLFGCMMGLLLATKHSAPLLVLPIAVGVFTTLAWRAHKDHVAWASVSHALGAVTIAFIVLWATYGFRYHESTMRDAKGQYVETFNRSLDDKIADLRSPSSRFVLTKVNQLHLLPRAYTWGMADTVRAGVEGRPIWVEAFGHDYRGKAPWWVFLAFLVVKIPVPFLLLTLVGVIALFRKEFEASWAVPLASATLLLTVVSAWMAHNGIFYAGIRHFLFVVPLMAMLAAAGATFLLSRREWWSRGLVLVALVLIAVDVLPQRRIWGYHNIIAGGSSQAWRKFSNESVDLGQRSGELIDYYNAHVKPSEVMVYYWLLSQQEKKFGINEWDPKPEDVSSGTITGWFFAEASGLASRNWYGAESMRDAKPVAQMGTLLVYHGSYYLPLAAAGVLSHHAYKMLYTEENGDKALAEKYLLKSVSLYPDGWGNSLELGNIAISRKDKAQALHWFTMARDHVKDDAPQVKQDIADFIKQLEKTSPDAMKPMRNPASE